MRLHASWECGWYNRVGQTLKFQDKQHKQNNSQQQQQASLVAQSFANLSRFAPFLGQFQMPRWPPAMTSNPLINFIPPPFLPHLMPNMVESMAAAAAAANSSASIAAAAAAAAANHRSRSARIAVAYRYQTLKEANPLGAPSSLSRIKWMIEGIPVPYECKTVR